MDVDVLISQGGRLMGELPGNRPAVRTPAHIYRGLLDAGCHWLLSALHKREDVKFANEVSVRLNLGYIRKAFSLTRTSRTLSPASRNF